MNQKTIYNKYNLYKEIAVLGFVVLLFGFFRSISFNFIDITKNTSYLSILSNTRTNSISLFQFSLSPYICSTFIFALFSWLIPSFKINKKEGYAGNIKNKKAMRIMAYYISIFFALIYMYIIIKNQLFYEKYQNIYWYSFVFLLLAGSSIFLISITELINKHSLINGISSIILGQYLVILFYKIIDFKNKITTIPFSLQSNAIFIACSIILFFLVFFFNYYVKRIYISYPIKEVLYNKYGKAEINIPIRLNVAGMFSVLLVSFVSPFITYFLNIDLTKAQFYSFLFIVSFIFMFTQSNYKNICNTILKNNGEIKSNKFKLPISVYVFIDLFQFSLFASLSLILIFFFSEYAVHLFMIDNGFNFASIIIVFSNLLLDISYNIKNNLNKNKYFII